MGKKKWDNTMPGKKIRPKEKKKRLLLDGNKLPIWGGGTRGDS